MATNRVKLFVDNFLIYGLGGMMSRLIPMLMLPLITRLYPGSEYIGLNDLNQTFIQFAQALAVCGMYDAMFRLFFDHNEEEGQKKVCSTAFFFVCGTSVFLAVMCVIFQYPIAEFYFGNSKYNYLVLITALGFLLSATNQLISAPTRIQNKKKVFLVTNTITPVISYAICIPMILAGNYLYAMPIGTVISAVVIEAFFAVSNNKYFSVRSIDRSTLKELFMIGLPLMPNFLVYWLYNSADKIMISQILGNSVTGIYSVSSKIGHISNLIYSAFSGGWLYFAYSTMHDGDQVQLKSKIFEYLGAVSFAATIVITGLSKLGFEILFPEEYLAGYIAVPYLFISPLLLMLYQVTANQFSVVKKTYLNLLSLSAGAGINIVLNYWLIPPLGVEGAAIATVTGYLVSIIICLAILMRMKLIIVNRAVYLNFMILLIYYAVWRFIAKDQMLVSILLAILFAGFYILKYRSMLKKVFHRMRGN